MRLNCQISDYDSASTCLLNSLICLYKKDEIPLILVKIIYLNSLDLNPKIIGDCASSKWTMRRICFKYKKASFKYDLDINYIYLCNSNVTFDTIKKYVDNKGVVIVRSKKDVIHYYLITNIDSNYVYIWDPSIYDAGFGIYNKVLNINEVDNTKDIDYSLGNIKNREIILATRYC